MGLALSRRIAPALRAVWWEYQRAMRPGGRAVRINGATTIQVDPAVNAPRGAEWRYEPATFRRFMAAIHSGDVVFDVGANQGVYAIAAGKRVGRTGRIYAFDPAPAAIDVLQRQIGLNRLAGVVRPVATVVGAEPHPAVLFHCAPTAVGWASAAYRPPGTNLVYTAGTSLDVFAECEKVEPRVIKIDVEGYEFRVLRGAERLLRTGAPVVFCAMHPEILAMNRETIPMIHQWMARWGYRDFGPDGRRAAPGQTEVIYRKAAR